MTERVELTNLTLYCFLDLPARYKATARARDVTAGRSGGGGTRNTATARSTQGVHARDGNGAALHIAHVKRQTQPKQAKELEASRE